MPQISNQRKLKSKQDRPCDRCRKLKQQCFVITRGHPCRLCQERDRLCTFDLPVPKRNTRKRTPQQSMEQRSARAINTDIEPAAMLPTDVIGFMDEPDPHPVDSTDIFDILRIEHRTSGSECHVADLTADLWDELDYDALDMTDWEESHFIGLGCLSDYGLGDFSAEDDTVIVKHMTFRQVSQDANQPVVFMRNPSRVFSKAGDSRELLDTVKAMMDEASFERLLDVYIERSLPAMPAMNAIRLRGCLSDWRGAGSYPHDLVLAILASAVVYIPELWSKGVDIWKLAVQALDDAYRRPINLRTVQTSLVHLSMRPNWNQSGSAVELARAIGAAKILGLHLDSSKWKLPRWERTVRKRVWWSLVLQDKWRAALFDRPSNLGGYTSQVPLPRVEDDDWGGSDVSAMPSMLCFVIMCKTTLILDDLHALDESHDPATQRVTALETASRRVALLTDEMSPALQDFSPDDLSPGLRSTQLALLGLEVIIMRKLLAALPAATSKASTAIWSSIIAKCEKVVVFLETLTEDDLHQFWQPFCYIHITNTIALLLHIASVHSHRHNEDKGPFAAAIGLAKRALQSVVRPVNTYGWDESRAIRCRTLLLLFSMKDPQIPQILSPYLQQEEAAETTQTDFFGEWLNFDFALLTPGAWDSLL